MPDNRHQEPEQAAAYNRQPAAVTLTGEKVLSSLSTDEPATGH
jgi:hypothetical protein